MACKRREEDKVLYKYNAIVLPQLYQTELLIRFHDQMGHQGIDKVYQRILKRFEWPGMKNACEKWVTACLSCQQVKDPSKLRFSLQSIESSEFNEVVQIDHQKICMTDSGYNQVLVMIDHFTKYAEAVPCITASAEDTCDHPINRWIARHGFPMTFQSDNGTAFVGELTKELMRRSHVAQAHSRTYHPQTNGLVERQNRTLVSMLRVYCSSYMTDWDRYLRSSSFFTKSMSVEATARFILMFDSSGWLRLLSISKSSRNLSIVSSSRCLRFSKRIIT